GFRHRRVSQEERAAAIRPGGATAHRSRRSRGRRGGRPRGWRPRRRRGIVCAGPRCPEIEQARQHVHAPAPAAHRLQPRRPHHGAHGGKGRRGPGEWLQPPRDPRRPRLPLSRRIHFPFTPNSLSHTPMQSIGERLEEARKKKGISIREAAETTKIRGDFLSQFENDRFDINLTEIYVRGFLRSYATYLKLSGDKILNDYASLGRGDAR